MQFSRFTVITYDYTSFLAGVETLTWSSLVAGLRKTLNVHPSIILIVHSENTPSTADRLVKETSCSWKLDCDVTMEAWCFCEHPDSALTAEVAMAERLKTIDIFRWWLAEAVLHIGIQVFQILMSTQLGHVVGRWLANDLNNWMGQCSFWVAWTNGLKALWCWPSPCLGSPFGFPYQHHADSFRVFSNVSSF